MKKPNERNSYVNYDGESFQGYCGAPLSEKGKVSLNPTNMYANMYGNLQRC